MHEKKFLLVVIHFNVDNSTSYHALLGSCVLDFVCYFVFDQDVTINCQSMRVDNSTNKLHKDLPQKQCVSTGKVYHFRLTPVSPKQASPTFTSSILEKG